MRGFIVVVADGGRDEKSKGEVGMGDLLLRTAVEVTVGDNVAEGGGG